MHSSVSGVVEYLVEDDAHGILKAREVMKSIDWNKRVTTVVRRSYEPPRFPAEELAGAIPVDPKVPYDFREVLARIVDDSSVEEFKSRYGVSTVCGYASITGISFGFIGNNGPIDSMAPPRRRSLFSSVMLQICPSCFSTTLPATWWAQSTSKRA